MSLRTTLSRLPFRRIAARRMSTTAQSVQKSSPAPKLPPGNDPAAYHGPEHAIGTKTPLPHNPIPCSIFSISLHSLISNIVV